jgi:hypothetical protein
MKTILILTLFLAACGGGGDDSPQTSPEVPKYHVVEPTTAPAKPDCSTTYPCGK